MTDTPTPIRPQSAAGRYTELHKLAHRQASDLFDALDDHMIGLQEDDVNWAHVGDLTYTTDRLQEILDFLKGEGR